MPRLREGAREAATGEKGKLRFIAKERARAGMRGPTVPPLEWHLAEKRGRIVVPRWAA